jgi:hypothetical protein
MTTKLWLIFTSSLLMALSIGWVIGYELRPQFVCLQGPSPRQGLTMLPDETGHWNCTYSVDQTL